MLGAGFFSLAWDENRDRRSPWPPSTHAPKGEYVLKVFLMIIEFSRIRIFLRVWSERPAQGWPLKVVPDQAPPSPPRQIAALVAPPLIARQARQVRFVCGATPDEVAPHRIDRLARGVAMQECYLASRGIR